MVYDLLMLCLLAMTTLRGKAKGIAWQLAGIASLVLCFLFATPLSAAIAPHITFLQPPLNRWASMLAAYLVFSFACFSVARGFRGFLESSRFEEFDKHLGALFGFIKGVTLCFVITFFAICVSDTAAAFVLQTKTGYISSQIMQQIQPVLPVELQNVMRKAAGQPLLGTDPFAIGQGTDPTTDPNANFSAPPRPGLTAEDGYDVWREQDDSLQSAPLFRGLGNQGPAGTPLPQSGTGNTPRTRAEFFGTSTGTTGGTNPAPAANGTLPPLFGSTPGNGIADKAEKALGVLKTLVTGNAPATNSNPPAVAPMSGSVAAPPITNNRVAGAAIPPLGNDELSFAPRTPQNFSPPATAPRPIGNSTAPSPFDDDDRDPPTTGSGKSFPNVSRTPNSGGREFDSNSRSLNSGIANSPSTVPRPSGFDDDNIQPGRNVTPLNAQPGLGSRAVPPTAGPSRFNDDALPPPGNVSTRAPVDFDSAPRAPSPDVFRGDSRSPSAPLPTRNSGVVSQPPRDDFDDLPRSRIDSRNGLNSNVAPSPDHGFERRPGDFNSSKTLPAKPVAVISNPGFGGSSSPRSGSGKPIDRTEEIQTLTSGIAVLISPPSQRAACEAQIRRAMDGLTQRTISHVLRDWQADLLGNGRDPNPQTDVATPLADRIALRLEYERQKAGGRGATLPGRPR